MDGKADVLVVGAGPTGLVLATALLIAGVKVRIVDRAASNAPTSRALGCQARSMEILEALGVADRIVAISEPVQSSVSYNEGGEIGRLAWVPPDSPFPFTYVFAQSGLERILRERVAELGGSVDWNWEATGLEQRDDVVVVRSADGRSIEAGWVAGCDGARSFVRRAAGIAFEGTATGETHYLADLVLERPPSMENALSWMGPEGPLMMMRMPGDPRHWRLFVDVTETERAGTLPAPSRELAQAIIDRRGFGPGAIKVEESLWESLYRTQVRQAAAYRKGRAFLAGDAAHVFPPYGGQGMNTGIQDAYNLAWKLGFAIKGYNAEAVLDTYHAERHPVGRQVIAEVEQRRRSFAVRGRIGRALRDLTFRLVLRSSAMQRRISLAMSQITLSYRGRSWLSQQTSRPARGRAGDRAPDGPLGAGRLFDVLSPARFTLLVFAGKAAQLDLPPWVEAVTVDRSMDRQGILAAKYDSAKGALVLVRPDGHIGFRGRGDDWAALRKYLARLAGGESA